MSIVKRKVGVTIGDYNGIGPELIINIFSDSRIFDMCQVILYGSSDVFLQYRKLLKNNEFNYFKATDLQQLNARKANIIECWEKYEKIEPGVVTEAAGKCAFKALKIAAQDLKDGKIDALVTAPINKSTINVEGNNFVGHTEYLKEVLNKKEVLMLLTSDTLRVGLVTGHVPVSQVAELISKELLQTKFDILYTCLQKDFGIQRPRIAILGLNPHAGDSGLIGKEDAEIIRPFVEEKKTEGKIVHGPMSADGFFGSGAYSKFDAVLAMYHDQGLVPFKTLAYEEGVNYTAGLGVVRTSPDHGTAYSLAGQNVASVTSMRNAIYVALDVLERKGEVVVEEG